MRGVEVLAHALGAHDEPLHHPAELREHVVEQNRRVGQHHALGGRVRDVALVPERHVFEADHSVASQDPGKARDALAGDRILLVWHRRRALLALAKRLLGLADLAALQVPELGRKAVEGRAGDSDRGEKLGMAIARDNLGRCGLDVEAKQCEHALLHEWVDVAVGTNGTRQLANADPIGGSSQTRVRTVEFEDPTQQLEPERCGLGVHAVCATHAGRGAVLERTCQDGGAGELDAAEQLRSSVAQLQRKTRVDNIRGSQTVMKPPRWLANLLGDRLRKSNHIVVSALLNLLRARDIDLGPSANRSRIGGWHDAEFDVCIERRQFHFKPCAEAPVVGPDGAHLRSRVAGDHPIDTSRRAGWRLPSPRR